MAALVSFEDVSKRFGDFTAVDGVSLDIQDGEFFALLGPSGCGKTTLLRMLAGFERPDAGRVVLGGADLTGVPPYRRPVNMMFQSYALFPHLTVAANVAFGLKQDGLPRQEIAARVDEMLALVQLSALAARKPDQLSGGQRQRVALARSLAKRPKVLLLDEPLAALDRKLREETRFELKAVQQKLKTTFVIVTHDQDEAMTVADRIGVMERGRLAQVGAPAEVYQRPNSRWVAGFVGDVNLIEARVSAVSPSFVTLEREGLKLRVAPSAEVAPGAPAAVALRPEKIAIAHAQPAGAPENGAGGVVTEIGYLGALSVFKVALDAGLTLKAAVMNGAAARPIAVRDRVWLSWGADAGVLLAE
ncbi:MAG: ABC transporter ATP-binding protein [Alphaproteobacteria bacterium]|nr:ABC transporter ATP-binding protein [Alphaproteobacteria bacterium]